MTKKILILAAMMVMTLAVDAKDVSQEMAASKAVQLLKDRIDGFCGEVASVRAVTYKGQKVYYVVQFSPQGWALISADDTSAPLIGYSDEGVYQTDNQPDNVRVQMESYGVQIINNACHLNKQHTGWQTLDRQTQRVSSSRASTKIDPLITVNWNQTGSYSKYCPTNNNGRAVVGCVAVAMAQAMSVVQYPKRPIGSYGYQDDDFGWISIDYEKEPAYNWDDILSGANNKDDVARLLWHCGVAVKMDYGVNGSGTQTSYIPNALKTYFSYPNSVKYFNRSSLSDTEWDNLILTELQEGRAVAYCGHDPKKNYGHCFNLDGYDGAWYHVNWGWGGANNGYFGLNGLRDVTMDMDYTDGQGVVVGIRPPSEYPSDILLSNLSVEATAPIGTVVATVTVESEASNPTYTFTVRGTRNPITHKYSSVPFTIEDMKLITTEEMPNVDSRIVEIIVKNNENGHELSRTFTINIVGSTDIDCVEVDNESSTYYSIGGQQQAIPHMGLNIVQKGKQVKKIIIK